MVEHSIKQVDDLNSAKILMKKLNGNRSRRQIAVNYVLLHAAEHTMRHTGQLCVPLNLVINMKYTEPPRLYKRLPNGSRYICGFTVAAQMNT